MLSYFQAIVIGLLQGVTELFPISSLGHSVLVPAWLGWDKLVARAVSGQKLLPRVSGRAAHRRARAGAVGVLPRRVGPNHEWVRANSADPSCRNR